MLTINVGRSCLVRSALLVLLLLAMLTFCTYVKEGAVYVYLLVVAAIGFIGVALVIRGFDIFEPLVWLLIMSTFFYIFTVLICFLGFDFIYHNNFSSRADQFEVLFVAVLVFTVGLVFYIAGDYSAELFPIKTTQSPFRNILGKQGLALLGAGLVCVGMINFLINSYMYNSSDVFMLLKDFGARNHRIQEGLFYSTLGYNLLVVGLFFLMLRRIAYFKRIGFVFKITFLICLVIILSTGRIWYTLSIAFVFIALSNFTGSKVEPLRVVFYCLLMCAMIIGVYFARLYSNLMYIESDSLTVGSSIGSMFDQIVVFIFGRSNVPSVPILMEVIDDYSRSQDYFGGTTLFYWLTYFLPGHEVTYLGHEIKERLYPGRPGGFPPTIFGEFYANGGFLFVLMGSFFLGFMLRLFYQFVKHRNNFLLYFVYSALLFRFIFMLPKLEFSALGSAVWLFFPTVLMCMVLKLLFLGGKAKGV